MTLRILGSRAFLSTAGSVLIALTVIATYLIYTGPAERYQTYCADLPDSIGLYRDSKVTLRGIAVGSVRALHSHGDSVRVEFTVSDKHRPTGELSATTVADSIVADRDLALLGDGGHAPWNPGTCITRTLTPKSLTQALGTLSRLSDELGRSSDGEPVLGAALRTLDQASAGSGDQINSLVRQLGSALNAPNTGVARIGRIIDALGELASAANRGWSDIEAMLTRFAPTFHILDDQLFPMVVELGDGLRTVLPMLNDLSLLAGGQLIRGLDAAVPLLRWISANIGGLQEVLGMVPAITSGFAKAIDSNTGKVTVTYAPPKVGLRHADAAPVCAALATLRPGLCDDAEGVVRLDLAQAVLGSVITR